MTTIHTRRVTISAGVVPRLQRFVSREETRYYLGGLAIEPHPTHGGAYVVATDGHRLGAIHDADAICPVAADGLPSTIILARTGRLLDAAKARPPEPRDGDRPWLVIDVRQWWEAPPADPKADDGNEAEAAATPKPPKPVTKGEARLIWASCAAAAEEAAARGRLALVGLPDALIDGFYPEWQCVVPRGEQLAPADRITFQPRYLADFAAAAGPHDESGGVTLWTTLYSPRSPDKMASSDATIVRLPGSPDFLGLIMPMRGSLHDALPPWLDLPPLPAPAAQEAAE